MKKISQPFKMKDRAGYYIRWYEHGKAKHKQFATLKEAEHYRHIQYMRLNNDVYTVIDLPFEQAKEEYLQTYDARFCAKSSKRDAERVLDHLWNICRPLTTKQITQPAINLYLATRQRSGIAGWTINKEIGRLRAFINWLSFSGYLQNRISLKLLSVAATRQQKNLSDLQIKNLLKACPSDEWRLRVLLGLCTGLRKNDLYRIKTADIDIDNGTVVAQEHKTGKTYTNYLPDQLMPLIKDHKAGVKYFFGVVNSRWLDKQFRLFRPDKTITIQSLRKTFATRIETTSISTQMLNHSGTGITRQFYNDLDYIKYVRVNQLPITEWLK